MLWAGEPPLRRFKLKKEVAGWVPYAFVEVRVMVTEFPFHPLVKVAIDECGAT
jgi:hypothetical protein